MRSILALVFLAVPLCLLVAAEAGSGPPDSAVERARIQAHLARVARLMRSAPTSHLTEQQQEARDVALMWLGEYRAAGVFPHNHVHPDGRVPVFVDPHGTPCAVGYLMLRSGHHDLVEEIVRTNNLIRVRELRDDERVRAWLEAHGITLEEAALIQPQYGPSPPPAQPTPVASGYRPATVGLSLATAAVASYTATLGANRGTPWIDALAFGTTLGHTSMVLYANDTPGDEPDWAVGLNVIGLVAGVASEVFRMVRRDDPPRSNPEPRAVQSYLVPGQHGTEIGLVIRY